MYAVARRRALLPLQSRQMSFKQTTVRHQSTKSAPLCRLNYRSHGIENFNDLWSSLTVFSNISKNKLLLQMLHSVYLLHMYCTSAEMHLLLCKRYGPFWKREVWTRNKSSDGRRCYIAESTTWVWSVLTYVLWQVFGEINQHITPK